MGDHFFLLVGRFEMEMDILWILPRVWTLFFSFVRSTFSSFFFGQERTFLDTGNVQRQHKYVT
jgi:hypothetical protein